MVNGAPYGVAYEGALRSLSQQEASLASVHSRAGTLISAIAISTSFLGAQALREGKFSCWTVAALAAFTAAIVCCMIALWPCKDKWILRIGGTTDEPKKPDLTGVLKPFTRGRDQPDSETKSEK